MVFIESIGLYLSYKDVIIDKLQVIAGGINLGFCLAILLMIFYSEPSEASFHSYYVGIIVIFSTVVALRLRFSTALINFTIIIVLYILIAIFKQDIPFYELANNLIFIFTVTLSISLANLLLENYTRETFFQEKLLKKQYSAITDKNRILTNQTNEIIKQKEKLEEINNNLSKSLSYAKKIQEATLPDISELKNLFSDAFIFYKPRNIVSGDFYWWAKLDTNNKSVVTVADCTGHGVPGAFMSILRPLQDKKNKENTYKYLVIR